MYYWLVAIDHKKKAPYSLFGPFNFKSEAQREADKLEVDSEIVELNTRSMAKATGRVKAIMAERYPERFREATSRYSHKR